MNWNCQCTRCRNSREAWSMTWPALVGVFLAALIFTINGGQA